MLLIHNHIFNECLAFLLHYDSVADVAKIFGKVWPLSFPLTDILDKNVNINTGYRSLSCIVDNITLQRLYAIRRIRKFKNYLLNKIIYLNQLFISIFVWINISLNKVFMKIFTMRVLISNHCLNLLTFWDNTTVYLIIVQEQQEGHYFITIN